MNSLAEAGKKLQSALHAQSKPLSTKLVLPKKKDSEALQKKNDEARKQLALLKQSNADVFSDNEDESRSSSQSYSSDEDDDFIDRGCKDERKGPFADLSPSNSAYSDEDDEEDEEEEGASMTLDSDSDNDDCKKKKSKKSKKVAEPIVKRAAKRPLSSEELQAMHAAQQENEKRHKTESVKEDEEREKRLNQLNMTIKVNIKEYEQLRQVAINALLQVQDEITVLEEKEKSCASATLFVLDQHKVNEQDRATTQRATALAEKERAFAEQERLFALKAQEQEHQLQLKLEALESREKLFAAKQDDVLAQFSQQSEHQMKELDARAKELDKKEKMLATMPVQAQQQQQQPLQKNGIFPGSINNTNNNLESFIGEMHKSNQNTLAKEMLNAIVSPVLMSNIASMALRSNTNNAPTFKTYSTSNSQFIILDVQNTEGCTLLRQVVSKQLYSGK